MVAIFVAFSLAYSLSEFFRISHAVIGPDLMAELDFTVSGLSLLASVFFITFAAMQLPNGLLFDKFGPRRIVPCLMAVGIAGATLFAVADSIFMLSVARAVMGIGWAVTFMGGLITLARWVPTERYAWLSPPSSFEERSVILWRPVPGPPLSVGSVGASQWR